MYDQMHDRGRTVAVDVDGRVADEVEGRRPRRPGRAVAEPRVEEGDDRVAPLRLAELRTQLPVLGEELRVADVVGCVETARVLHEQLADLLEVLEPPEPRFESFVVSRPQASSASHQNGGSGAGPTSVGTTCTVVDVIRNSERRSSPPQQRLPQTSGVATDAEVLAVRASAPRRRPAR